MFVLVLTSSELELFSTLCQFRLGLQSNADIRDLSTSFTEFLQVICLLVSRSIPLISLNTGHCVAKPLDSWAALGRSPWCRGGSRADSGPPQLRFERHKRVHKVFLNMWCAQNHRRQRYKPCRNLRTPHLFHYVLMRISQFRVVVRSCGVAEVSVITDHQRNYNFPSCWAEKYWWDTTKHRHRGGKNEIKSKCPGKILFFIEWLID